MSSEKTSSLFRVTSKLVSVIGCLVTGVIPAALASKVAFVGHLVAVASVVVVVVVGVNRRFFSFLNTHDPSCCTPIESP